MTRTMPVLALLLAWTCLVYLPGLNGDFVFDDYFNVVDNQALRPDALTPQALAAAAVSSDSGPLKRAVASLSFLANFELFGPQPLSFKVVNLLIHLLNGYLILCLLRRVLPRLLPRAQAHDRLALLITGLWLVHPLNLTAVLYVVQRMTSLAATFMLLAMLGYLRLRESAIAQRETAGWRAWAAVAGAGALGLATKESAALLPLYIGVLEVSALRFRAAPVLRRWFGAGIVAVVAGVGYLWWMTDFFTVGFSTRPFSAEERMLTELRVLVFYLWQILCPLPSGMALLHSDWEISRSMLAPWTTAAALVFWLSAIAVSLAAVRRHPLLTFATGWFLCGHLLESTIIPLDLVYEHRNYLPSLGVLCLVGAGIQHLSVRQPQVGRILVIGILLILGVRTAHRAWQWGDAFTLAVIEARHNPDSSRARHELARRAYQIYLRARTPESLALVRRELDAAMRNGDEDFGSQVSLLNTYLVAGEPLPDALMRDYEEKLRTAPPTGRRLGGIHLMIRCQMQRSCRPAPEFVVRAVSAVLANPKLTARAKSETLEWLAIYYTNLLGDLPAARNVIEDAVRFQPTSRGFRLRLIEILVLQQNWPEARREIERLERQMTPWARMTDPALAARFDRARDRIINQDDGRSDA